MDTPNYKDFQPPSALASHRESTMEPNLKLYRKNKDNPFTDAFPDPLCNLNLRETSEFVRSFPISNGKDNTEKSSGFLENVSSQRRRREGSNFITQRKLQETPSIPGRPSFTFTSINNLSRKTFPSKWDDAEKWLTSSSCHAHNNMKILSETSNMRQQFDISKEQMEGFSKKSRNIKERVSKAVPNFHGSTSLDHHNAVRAFNGVSCSTATDIVLKDESTDNTEFTFSHFTNSEPTKEGDLLRNQGSESMKDACTEVVLHHIDAMTETTTTSRCHTSFKSHNKSEQCHFDKLKLEQRHNKMSATLASANQNSTAICTLLDIIRPEQCHFDKLKAGTECDSITSNWGSREEQQEEISNSLKNDIDCRAAQWEEDEKCCLRYQREGAKIQAWVNIQSAKAEAKSRKLEVKIEKMRSKLEKKLMKKMAVVHRKADEWRVAARLQHLEQIQKATGQSQKMMINNYDPHFSSHSSCGCFPRNNNHH